MAKIIYDLADDIVAAMVPDMGYDTAKKAAETAFEIQNPKT